MDNAVRWLWRVTGRKKGYVLALTLVQGANGGLGVLYALLLRNIVDSAVGHDSGAFWHNVVLIIALVSDRPKRSFRLQRGNPGGHLGRRGE